MTRDINVLHPGAIAVYVAGVLVTQCTDWEIAAEQARMACLTAGSSMAPERAMVVIFQVPSK